MRAVWAGIRRAKGTAQAGKAPALTADVRAMVATLPETLPGLRHRALLLGSAGAFWGNELVGRDVRDPEAGRAGLVVALRRSKTDQEGEGRKLGVPYSAHPGTCPRRAVQEWLHASVPQNPPDSRRVMGSRNGESASARHPTGEPELRAGAPGASRVGSLPV